VILNKEYNTKKIDVSLNIGESHMIMSMDESNKNNESVPNKDCNEEMTDVTSITGKCAHFQLFRLDHIDDVCNTYFIICMR